MENKVYQMVTDRILAEMEKGIIPWNRPWTGVKDGAISHTSGKPYSYLNQLILGKAGEWLTFKQIEAEGGKVKKGEKSSFCVFFKDYTYETEDEETQEKKKHTIPILRYYNVWHIDQCEGINPKWETEQNEIKEREPIAEAEKVISGYVEREKKLSFQNQYPSNRAYYSPLTDSVVVPMPSQYEVQEEYYSTTFHELTHSTGASHRLNRKGIASMASFGGEVYSKEELVAEIGSAMLCSATGIDNTKVFQNSVAYLQSWSKALKDDVKMIVIASGQAEKASKFILGVQD